MEESAVIVLWVPQGQSSPSVNGLSRQSLSGQLFKTFNLDQNDPDLEIPIFPIQDQVIHLTFMPVFQSNIGLDHPDPDTHSFQDDQIRITSALNGTTYHNVGYQLRKKRKSQHGVTVSVSYFETKNKWGQDNFCFIFTLLY